jgi:hypothetical protein
MARFTFSRIKDELGWILAVAAFALSGASFYVSYFYKSQQLDIQVTSVSFNTNQGELYMTVAFSNGGNRDAALLRVEPAIWSQRKGASKPDWAALDTKIAKDVPLADPKVPRTVKAGGVEVVRLSAKLTADDAASAAMAAEGGAFVGVTIASMNSDGKLYLVQHPVAKLRIDSAGRIQGGEATIHKSLSGFSNSDTLPPGDQLQKNEQTPFVWADQRN